MESVYWSIIIVMFIVAFIGLVFPIIPSSLFVIAGFLLYGVLFSFEPLNWFFWVIQGTFVVLLFGADYAANLIGVKKYGGSKAAVWGSTIGLLVGPIILNVFGIILGPFIGAIIAEAVVNKKGLNESVKVGIGSVVGLISSIFAKTILQGLMIAYFLYQVS
ncbi:MULTISPECIES: DUF456 domain-containing protein [unclassified Bacillus (in: firmicutes)]|uniref:DUF456 domain-containing protein n=1 Tax=unclassified Bacillus (in: firmicutes) TaxID=185979 RepID=UPI0008E0DB1D|nr:MULTISPECIES: DUF456 domain-containing protein [unclassified Bacillus (in: firmicutes)]SFA96023.1 hypothetical protein SAMN02799634_103133 [Bacillus sp. UNCCL13]SFQ79541.1 hypothetical protein SAMN04488577_1766 [Bacillus sp. cl95]